MGESRLGLLIASPPCPTFSSAGKGAGRRLTDLIVSCMGDLLARIDSRAARTIDAEDLLASAADEINPDEQMRRDAAMSMLVVEPLRYAIELRPTYVALEQVPPVLGLWEIMATKLRVLGYRTWTGILEAERYGVAQTRKRAILLASLNGQPALGTAGAVTRATAEYRQDEDVLGAFLEERCEMAGEVSTAELRDAYERFCEELGEKPLAANMLGRRLGRRGVQRRQSGGMRFYGGVRLR